MASTIHFDYGAAKVHWVDTPGSRIRSLRKTKGLTQPQLAEAVGIDQSTISDIERGAGINAAVLMRLCDALEAPADFIMRGRSAAWPLRKVAIERFLALAPEDRAYVEGRLEAAIEQCESAGLSHSPKVGYTQVPMKPGELPEGQVHTEPSTDEVKRRLQRKSGFGAGNEVGKAGRVPGKRGGRRA